MSRVRQFPREHTGDLKREFNEHHHLNIVQANSALDSIVPNLNNICENANDHIDVIGPNANITTSLSGCTSN